MSMKNIKTTGFQKKGRLFKNRRPFSDDEMSEDRELITVARNGTAIPIFTPPQ
jgi:hypothetical protein